MTTKQAPDGTIYQQFMCESAVLAEISNTAQDFGLSEVKCWFPASQTEVVLVYVLETDYGSSDFTTTEQTGRFDFLTQEEYKPGKNNQGHGAKVINLLAGQSFGVARSSKIRIIPVTGPREDVNDVNSKTLWAGALKAIAIHFNKAVAKGIRYGIVNCSRALEKRGNVEGGFKDCVDAGLIMMGAAGNRGIDLDDPTKKSSWPLPEANDATIVIGSLDRSGEVFAGAPPSFDDGSSFGARVDYWVRGVELKCFDGPKASGTSFACPIATGVVASMLSAGQVPSGKVADVRKKLDEWAVPSVSAKGPMKTLRNAPGLNQ